MFEEGKIKNKVSDSMLNVLIEGLLHYRSRGVIDPWVLEDGTTIDPVDTLLELRELRLSTKKS